MITSKLHTKTIWGLAFSPDGNQLASIDADGEVILSQPLNGEELRRTTVTVYCFNPSLAYAPDGNSIVLASGFVHVWNLTTGELKSLGGGVSRTAGRVCFRPDGSMIAAAGNNATTDMHHEFDDVMRWAWPSMRGLPGWEESMTTGSVAFSPDGSLLASGHLNEDEIFGRHRSHFVTLRNPDSGNVQKHLTGSTAPISALAFSPDGTQLASLAGINLRVWDIESRELRATRKVGTKHFKDFAFTPDGRHLLTVSNDRTVRVWETDTWTESAVFEWQLGRATSLAIAPDGLRAAVGGGTGKIIIFDLDT